LGRIALARLHVPPQDAETARWFEEHVRPHESSLRAWLRSRFPKVSDANDLVQDSFIRLLRAREAGPVDRQWSSYIAA
jgi:DNA-directed RNA polymerase specialized sigma24 family protein